MVSIHGSHSARALGKRRAPSPCSSAFPAPDRVPKMVQSFVIQKTREVQLFIPLCRYASYIACLGWFGPLERWCPGDWNLSPDGKSRGIHELYIGSHMAHHSDSLRCVILDLKTLWREGYIQIQRHLATSSELLRPWWLQDCSPEGSACDSCSTLFHLDMAGEIV